MSRPWSLQRRLGLGLGLGITAMWLVATVIAGLVVRGELDEAFDSALQETAQRLLPIAAAGAPRLSENHWEDEDEDEDEDDEGEDEDNHAPDVREHDEYLTYVVLDGRGRVLFRSHAADRAVFPNNPSTGFSSTATHRIYTEWAADGSLAVEIAEPLAHRREASLEAILALAAPLPLLVPLSLAGVWWLLRSSMRPVLDLRGQIESRGHGNLEPVTEGRLPSEIAPVAASVNRLLHRLRHALEAERAFTANSAHELRTPIAATLAQTQRLIAESSDAAVRERAQRIESSLRHLARLSEKLMQLARAEGGGLLSERPEDLAPVLSLVVDEFRDKGRELYLKEATADELRSDLDPDVFAILMRNLIENAFRHGRPDRPVEIVHDPDRVIRVVNAAEVVPAETLSRLKGRFVRGVSRATGSGLGLAIAEMIANGAGIELDLRSPASGRDEGFEVVLRFPPPGTARSADA